MRFQAIIFDFDGVIVDSELVSNAVLAEALTILGHPTTTQEAVERYIGLHWGDAVAKIEAEIGRPLPPDFRATNSQAFQRRLEEVRAVEGVQAFLEAVPDVPKAVASSSSSEWLRLALTRFGLLHHFGARLFSAAEHVKRGKPHPDIYLHAAAALGAEPSRTLVIEDTAPGITAAKAAGMQVVGLCAGGHCGPGYGERLRSAAADAVVASYAEVIELIR